MTNEDYQLEELENAAVKKSNNAKRVAAAAGLLAVGGGAAYAATTLNPEAPVEELDDLDEEELDGQVDTAANQVHEPEVQPTPKPNPKPNPVPVHDEEDNDVDVSFDKTTHYYDEDGNLIMTTEEGTVDGHDFKLVDVDNDGQADLIGIDVNGNGIYEEDEIADLTGGNQISMGNPTSQHEDIFIATTDPGTEPEPYYDPIDEKYDYADNGDYNNEKEGESYAYNDGEDYKDDSDYGYTAMSEESDSTFDDLGSDSIDLV